MGITLMLMESNTTANTLLTRKKGTVSTIGQMGELMQDTGAEESSMESVFIVTLRKELPNMEFGQQGEDTAG